MQPVFSVDLATAQEFQKVWTYKGVAIPLPPEAAHFAKDFGNIVLRSFIEQCQQQVKDAEKNKHVVKKELITEGL